MPIQRLAKLEELTIQLEDIIINMQKVSDLRQERADSQYNQLTNITAALQQQVDNTQVNDKEIELKFNTIQTKLHVISNHIMSLTNSVEELAEYMGLLEANQIQIKAKLQLTDE
jgi:conjugal transfer/entry exclusion protein